MSRNDDITGDTPEDSGQNPGPRNPGGEPVGGSGDTGADGYARGEGQSRGAQSWPHYQPTEHPEDVPGGFQPGNGYGVPRYPGNGAGTSGYQGPGYPGTGGASPYNGYSVDPGAGHYAQGPYGAGLTPGAGLPTEPASGRVDVMRAVRFGFRAVFANPLVWILGTLMLGLLYILFTALVGVLAVNIDPEGMASGNAFSAGNVLMNLVILAVTIIISIGVMHGALVSVDGRRTALREFLHPVNATQTILLYGMLTALGLVIGMFLQGIAQSAVMVDPSSTMVEFNSSALSLLLLFYLVLMFLNPLYGYWVWYTADGRESAASAIGVGFRDALRNYPKLLAYSFLGGIVVLVASVVTFGLALLVFLPVSILISAHLYRQMSGGVVPVERNH